MSIHKIAMLSVAALLTATTAMARDPVPEAGDTFELYGEVDGWNVYKVLELESCLAERIDETGNVIQMGLTKNHKHGYIGVFTLADIDIKNRKKFEIDVDGYVYEGRAKGLKSRELQGDYSGGYLVIKDDNMVTAIAEGQTLTAFPKRSDPFVVDLTGTKKAIEEGRKCNLELAG
jgi:hypothetical protein